MNAKSIEVLASRREPFHQRMLLVFGVIGYVALFQWMYENYLYPNWDYAGFHYYPPPAIYLALGWLLSATPSLWMPMRLTRPSQYANCEGRVSLIGIHKLGVALRSQPNAK